MRLLPCLVLAIAVAVAVAGTACSGDDGHDHEIDAAPSDGVPALDAAARQVITATQSLVPGELVEGIMTGGPTDRAKIHLEAPVAELDWNIHGHQGGATQTVHDEFNVMVVDYEFVPTSQTDWWLLIRNSGPTAMDIQVRVELFGDLQWRWE